MPFTFSHPAIILPATYLPKHTYSLSALVIGSMTPDFEYFIRFSAHGHFGHTLPGLFLFDLPMGLLIAFLFHLIVRDSLIDHLPVQLQSRFIQVKGFDWVKHFKKHWAVAIISLLVGAFSHIFWDSFTHINGFFVQRIPFLSENINFLGHDMFICRIFQYVSTVIGGVVIAYAVFKMPKHNLSNTQSNASYWIILSLIFVLVFSFRLFTGLNVHHLHMLIINSITCGLLGLLFTPVILRLRKAIL